MNLKNFHLFFVIASITLTGWFGFWCLGEGAEMMGPFHTMYGIASMVSTLVLAVYGVRTYLKLSKLVQES